MNHERLQCYHILKAIAHTTSIAGRQWPKGNGELQDQLKRAMISALLNLVEGNTRKSQKERRRFFEVSRGSIAEVSACIDVAAVFGLISQSETDALKSQLRHCYAMIRKLP